MHDIKCILQEDRTAWPSHQFKSVEILTGDKRLPNNSSRLIHIMNGRQIGSEL